MEGQRKAWLLDDEIVTVHASFDEQIPDRPSEYYDEIDNLMSQPE
jgi:hypothetical protein